MSQIQDFPQEPHASICYGTDKLKSEPIALNSHGVGAAADLLGGGSDPLYGIPAPSAEPTVTAPVSAIEDGLDTYPDGGLRAWIVVLGSTAIMVPTYGLMTAVGLFQVYWKDHQLSSHSNTEIAWIISVFGFLDIFLAGPAGVLFDRMGARKLLFPASAVYFCAYLGLAFSSRYEHFMACFVVAGSSASVLTTIAAAVINHWFSLRKGLAMGIATMGGGIGGIFFSVLLQPLFERLPWRDGMLILSCIICGFVTIGTLCICSRIPPRTDKFFDFSCFKSLRFILTTWSISGFELVLFASWGLIPTYSKVTSLGNGFYLMLALNLGSTLGRIIPGYLSDRLGSLNVTLVMAAFTLLVILGVWLPVGGSSEAGLYIVSVCLGFGTGSFVSTSAICLGRLCNARDAGKYLGSCYTVVSLSTLLSTPACQHILNNHGHAALIGFLAGVLTSALLSCLVVRWACLGYRWAWVVKV